MSSSLDAYFEELRELINAALDALFPPAAVPAIAFDPMRYALLGGGKRLRPCLTLSAAEAIGLRSGVAPARARSLALQNACAVEMVHSYSLVHDDLPAMDNDTLRRGRPTTHVVYGDGLAILAGDGLLTEAFAAIAGERPVFSGVAPPPEVRLRSVAVLAAAAGAAGMVGGQALDLLAAGQVSLDGQPQPATPLGYERLKDMHARKTGALIQASVSLGAIALHADEPAMRAIDGFGRELGLAFQIIDDVLDVEGTAGELGKTAGKDAADHKVTYPSLFGLDRSRVLASESVERAKAALASASVGGRLAEIADWSLRRKN
jgi:geranylgeranyl pyrophosphate synthase